MCVCVCVLCVYAVCVCVHCSGAGCIVVNVEYRLAPEHKFPAMMDDGCCVANWVLNNKANLGTNKQTLVQNV